MAELLTKQKAIDEIVKEVKKLDKLELQILLTKLRVKKMQNEGVKPVANLSKKIKMPAMKDINLWKHEARNEYAHR